MTPFSWFLAYKSKKKKESLSEQIRLEEQRLELDKEKYLINLRAKIKEEMRQTERILDDLKDAQIRHAQAKEDLYKANEELREQIRVIEAKARPDAVWVEAFTCGFSKAWDIMAPLMNRGIEKAEGRIRSVAIEETLKRLKNGHKLPPS